MDSTFFNIFEAYSDMNESEDSEQYEKDVAKSMTRAGFRAERIPGNQWPDVRVFAKPKIKMPETFIECKMETVNNLIGTRLTYANEIWSTNHTTSATQMIINVLSGKGRDQISKFLDALSRRMILDKHPIVSNDENFNKLSNDEIERLSSKHLEPIRRQIVISSTKAANVDFSTIEKALKDAKAHKMYIMSFDNEDLTSLFNEYCKSKNVWYIQAGDGFYRVTSKDPLNLNVLNVANDRQPIPLFEGSGYFKLRFSTDTKSSHGYRIIPEIKMRTINDKNNPYSVKLGSSKINPFKILLDTKDANATNGDKFAMQQ